MKFRQRLAWLFVLVYLGGTFGCFYYIFEINDHYNSFALDHVQRFHSQSAQKQSEGSQGTDSQNQSVFLSFWNHLTDLPLPVWMMIFLLPYMQLFMMILACTRAEPKLSIAYMWPGLVYLKYQQLLNREKSSARTILSGDYSSQLSNGNAVLHT